MKRGNLVFNPEILTSNVRLYTYWQKFIQKDVTTKRHHCSLAWKLISLMNKFYNMWEYIIEFENQETSHTPFYCKVQLNRLRSEIPDFHLNTKNGSAKHRLNDKPFPKRWKSSYRSRRIQAKLNLPHNTLTQSAGNLMTLDRKTWRMMKLLETRR